MQNRNTWARWLVLTAAGGFGQAVIAESNATKLMCSAVSVSECYAEYGCDQVSPLSGEVPSFFQLDIANKAVETIWQDGRREQSGISSIARNEGLVVMQGVEASGDTRPSAIGWTMTIDEASGHMVIVAAGREIGYTLFGACIGLE